VARSAIAVDQLSAGRLELGVGTGAFGDQAMAGMLEMAPRERIERLREGVRVIDRLLRGDLTPFGGKYAAYTEAHTEPGCLQSPRVPITIGAVQRRAIEVAVDLADTWSTYSDLLLSLDEARKDIVARVQVFEEQCATKGRDPDELRRSLLVLNPLDAWAVDDHGGAHPGNLRRIRVQRVRVPPASATSPVHVRTCRTGRIAPAS